MREIPRSSVAAVLQSCSALPTHLCTPATLLTVQGSTTLGLGCAVTPIALTVKGGAQFTCNLRVSSVNVAGQLTAKAGLCEWRRASLGGAPGAALRFNSAAACLSLTPSHPLLAVGDLDVKNKCRARAYHNWGRKPWDPSA